MQGIYCYRDLENDGEIVYNKIRYGGIKKCILMN